MMEEESTNLEPMFSGGIGITETETYGMKYGEQKADELLREYFQLCKHYADHAGITVINPQHYTKYRGCNFAAEVFTNAYLITPGNSGTYLAKGGERGRTWVTNGIPCIGTKEAYYITKDEDQLQYVLDFARDGIAEIYSYIERPQFWTINVLGNYTFPDGKSDLYYQYIGTDRLLKSDWYEGKNITNFTLGTIVPVQPSTLGQFYKESLNQ